MRLALHWQILIAMIVGAGVGVTLNLTAGKHTTPEPIPIRRGSIQLHGMDQPAVVPRSQVWLQDTPDHVAIQLSALVPPGDQYRTRRLVVGAPDTQVSWPPLPPQVDSAEPAQPLVVPSLAELHREDPTAYALFQRHGRSLARRAGDAAEEIGGLFLRLLKMVSIPLVITSLVTGVTGLGHAERLGKMFGRTFAYYLVTSMLAIVVGLTSVNVIRPGASSAAAALPALASSDEGGASLVAAEGKGLGTVMFEQLESMIPTNPIAAVASGDFLSIISFSIVFSVFAILVGGRTLEIISDLAAAAFEVMMRITMAIILLAPIGVLFLMLSATAAQGLSVFQALGLYMVAVACGLLVHAAVTLPLILRFVARRSPTQFLGAMSPALLTAFSSASSNGTLPLTITCAEERAGISNRVTSFVLPLGATVNMDGTALYEAVAVLFIAQLTGHDLTLAQQIIVAITALLASIGAAGIPHAGLVMMIIILQAVGLPTEAQGLIIAVDRVLDMARTSVNVWSDACGCAVVARFEAESA